MIKKQLLAKQTFLMTGVAAFIFMAPLQAKAGFEWTPPQKMKSAPSYAPAVVEVEEIDQVAVPMPKKQMPPAKAILKKQSSEMTEQNPVSYSHIEGFGNDIPLVLALQQIVPLSYSYTFDGGIDKGQRISWSGGKSWDKVLLEALASRGMTAVISNQKIWVQKSDVVIDPRMNKDVMQATVNLNEQEKKGAVFDPVQESAVKEKDLILVASDDRLKNAAHNTDASIDVATSHPVSLAVPTFEEQEKTMPPQSYPRRQKPGFWDEGEMLEEEPALIPSLAIHENSALQAPSVPPSLPEAVMPQRPVVEAEIKPGVVMDQFEIHYWEAAPNESLKTVLERWAAEANVAVLWRSPYDYVLPRPVELHGTFSDALTQVLSNYNAADPRPLGKLHPNLPQGPSVLVIENWSSATN